MMSALSHQVNMNNFLSLLVGASLVAANSSPSHDIASLSQPTEFSNGVSSFALPAEERMAIESFVMAYLNYSYTGSDGHLVELGGNESAKYGEGRVLNRSGILVHISNSVNRSDHTGCYKHWSGTLGESIPDRSTPWIALVRRGGCNFEDKVKHAYEHGAAGVIIYNDKGDSKLDKMKINDKERNITAVFTSKAMGLELIEILEVHKYDVHMRIIEGSHQFHPLGNINRTSVLFVSISFIVLMIISLVWLVFYYVQRFRYLQTKDKQSKRLCSVAKRIIAKIPTKSIKSDDKEIDNDCCAICIEPYKVTDVIRVLPCKHEFHKVCIDPWLLEHRTCPMCKMDILKHYGFVFTGSQESILQLDMDMEEGDLIDDRSSTDGGYQRRNSVSPLPQIRASNENQMSRSSSDSDSEQDHEDCVTPQSSGRRSSQGRNKRDSQRQHEKSQQDGDICVGCLAAALNKKQKNNDNAQEDGESDSYATEENGSKSLPATLKKYKGNHSTGSCRGMNPPDHYHPYPYNDKHGSRVYQNQQPQNSAPEEHSSQQSSNLPFKFYKTESGQPRKVRTPLRNLIPQSISAPCDTDSSLRVCIHGGIEQHFSEATTSKTGTLHANAESEELPAVHISQRPIDAKRRCSLSRNSSCSSADRKDVVTCEDLKIAIDYSNEEDVSDETEPNSDNDLIIRRSERGDEKETRKK
ncbi:protein goliath [Anopheles funestus]|uniref:protein goliath n=1 Tax=Anopheles funestus TaxID=62324 RepID=UPI0020C68CA4|nr:protein goliath [Anopheles funestus]XP_049298231.1 protein goliath [Anopheles funestus]XP_049298232.1 protein goliath [Anopheles funestus]XP_049298233.1 protein goliath [Anopheles funestus]